MALALSTRPAEWSAVKNPVVYTFTTTGGPFVNYRVEVEIFKAVDNTSLTGGIKFSYSPGSDSITYADVSTIIEAYLKAEWIEPSALNEVEADTHLKYYIKYQELYDGSAVGVVDDVANLRDVVFGALQIPSAIGNNLDAYVPEDNTKKFLTVFDRPKIWRGYPATLSLIYPDNLGALHLFRANYDAAGVIIGSVIVDVLSAVDEGKVNRIDLNAGLFALEALAKTITAQIKESVGGVEILDNPSFVATLATWATEGGAGEPWTWNAGEYAETDLPPGGGASENLTQPFAAEAAGSYYLVYEVDPNTTDVTIIIEVYDTGVLVEELVNEVLTGTLTTYTKLVDIPAAFDQVKIRVTHASLGPIVELHSFSLKPEVVTEYTEVLTLDVEEACENPVLLQWKNSIGGDASWLFEHGQESGYSLSGQKKAKRMTLFGDHLSLNQWEGINELNHLGEVYKQNIVDFTSSINKSHVRDGSQAYVVDADGNKTGVIVIPTSSVINTRDVTHKIEIEIEFPERFE